MAGEWAQRPHSLFPTEGDQKAPVWDSPALCHLSPTTHYYFCFRRSSDAAILLLFIVSCIWALPSYSLSAPYPASALHVSTFSMWCSWLELRWRKCCHLVLTCPFTQPGFVDTLVMFPLSL